MCDVVFFGKAEPKASSQAPHRARIPPLSGLSLNATEYSVQLKGHGNESCEKEKEPSLLFYRHAVAAAAATRTETALTLPGARHRILQYIRLEDVRIRDVRRTEKLVD